MDTRRLVASILIAALFGFPGKLGAVDQKAPRPTLQLARRLQAHKNYVDAILVYEKLLEKDPGNRHVIKLMIRCHDVMLRKELAEAVVTTPPEAEKEEEILPNLPELVPNEPKNWPALRSKPKST